MENSNNVYFKDDSNSINIREELEKYLIHWRWFLIFVLFSFLLSYFYLRYTTPTYTANSAILIKDNQKSGISDELKAVADLGIVGTGSVNNTDNEIEVLKSRKIISRVVDSLGLRISIYSQGRIKTTDVYDNVPFKIVIDNKSSENDTSFVLRNINLNSFELTDLYNSNFKKFSFNELIPFAKGNIIIKKTTNFIDDSESSFLVVINKRDKTIDNYQSRINISPANKNSSVLNLNLTDAVPEKAEDILDELVKQYNLDAITDKSLVSVKTKEFIEERLKNVAIELSQIQDNVETYKTKYGISGLSEEAILTLENVNKSGERFIELKTQMSLVKSIQQEIQQQTDSIRVLPVNLGFEDAITSTSINKYNELVLKKNRLDITAGKQNPSLLALVDELKILQRNLLANLKNLEKSLQIQISKVQEQVNKTQQKVNAIPLIERGLIDIERQKEIYSELYSYLLKKKEETAISLAVTVPNAKIIDYAYSNRIPVSPKKKIIYLAALLLGLLIPFVVIYIKNLLDTKIHTKKDLENLISIPYLGDVPHSETEAKIIIDKSSRTSTSEAFRLIRTNLDFILSKSKNEKGHTIFITSTTSGEGKSFISINLAAALSLSNKKVLLMGMDLRAPKVTEYLGLSERIGITNYITNENVSIDELKFQIPEIAGLDIISSGVIPPNPAELLLTDRVRDLYTQVKNDYDFVIVDTAPVNLVTDTLLMSKYADMTVYVTRANYLDKRMLAVPETLYQEKKLPNMAIILNDTDINRGYGYGYGYGYVQQEQKVWYKRLLGIK